jgi:outer membrane translocation and assembly module TamA
MPTNTVNIVWLYETLLDQQKSLRDIKLQIESLKSMMFTHRPQFVEDFAKHEEIVGAREFFKTMDAQITHLETTTAALRQQWK